MPNPLTFGMHCNWSNFKPIDIQWDATCDANVVKNYFKCWARRFKNVMLEANGFSEAGRHNLKTPFPFTAYQWIFPIERNCSSRYLNLWIARLWTRVGHKFYSSKFAESRPVADFEPRAPPPPQRPNYSVFHVVFGKNLRNLYPGTPTWGLAPPSGKILDPPLEGTPQRPNFSWFHAVFGKIQ